MKAILTKTNFHKAALTLEPDHHGQWDSAMAFLCCTLSELASNVK